MPSSKKRKKNPETNSDPKPSKKGSDGRSSALTLLAVAAIIAGVSWFIVNGGAKQELVLVPVTVPELSQKAQAGRVSFNGTCAACHGQDGQGGKGGPPLIYPIYRPGHHADGAIRVAIKFGVKRHHWKFGTMPPQSKIGNDEIPGIIAFLRETQSANGVN